VSSFPSISIPSIPMPIPSILMPTSRSFSGGGSSLGFNMGGGNPSTSTNPMSNPTSLGAGVPFGWNISSGFGVVPSQLGVVVHQEVSNFLGLAHPSLGAHPLGEIFTMGRISFC
jgi:hypothetical protein